MIDNSVSQPASRTFRPSATLLVLGAALLWAYWSILVEMRQRWESDPTYSHGYLVPIFALAILWLRRGQRPATVTSAPVWGLGFILLGAAMQMTGSYIFIRTISAVALLPYLVGVTLLLGGWGVLRWAAPSIAFLAFMMPLPWRIEVLMRAPLQRISTIASTYALQTLGYPALAEGNIILLNDVELGVVDACSGLKMLIVFFALSTAVALLVKRRFGDRLLIILSALPIAIFSNVVRITVTGVLHETVGAKLANMVFHDLAGWLMMPLALALLWGEIAILSLLIIEDNTAMPSPILSPVEPMPRAIPSRVAHSGQPQ
jgi:exosortase